MSIIHFASKNYLQEIQMHALDTKTLKVHCSVLCNNLYLGSDYFVVSFNTKVLTFSLKCKNFHKVSSLKTEKLYMSGYFSRKSDTSLGIPAHLVATSVKLPHEEHVLGACVPTSATAGGAHVCPATAPTGVGAPTVAPVMVAYLVPVSGFGHSAFIKCHTCSSTFPNKSCSLTNFDWIQNVCKNLNVNFP